jgi:hypothetical protein
MHFVNIFTGELLSAKERRGAPQSSRDVAYRHIAPFRCDAELGHYRGIANIEQRRTLSPCDEKENVVVDYSDGALRDSASCSPLGTLNLQAPRPVACPEARTRVLISRRLMSMECDALSICVIGFKIDA